MKAFGIASAAIAAAGLFASSVSAQTTVDPIVIKGSKFFYKTNGTQFYMRGVAYQQDYSGNGTESSNATYIDPLADEASCARDIPLMEELRTNTIRVYAIDPTKDHSACMNLLAEAGIYVISDLSSPDLSIDRSDPEWNTELYARYTSVVDALANYTNTLGFFAGNEVSNEVNNTAASAFVKAAVRDTKAYIKSKDYRAIGVGYATNDDASIRVDMADYFNCGAAEDAIDFWGYNIYSWCGVSSYEASGYEARTEEFSNYSVPAFFAEYGCNTQGTRTFDEAEALYGPSMTPVWSGGIVYMWFQEANDYGLVSVTGDTASKLPDFDNLSSRLATLTPTGTIAASYTPSNTAQACPAEGTDWDAQASPLPPSPNEELCACMYDTLSCVVDSSVSSDDYGTIFGYLCGLKGGVYCDGIDAYGNNGTYGSYSMCNTTQQLAFVINEYVEAQTGAAKSSACDFSGSATSVAAATATGQCSSLIAEAGTAGTGTVTSSPTGTGAGAASSAGSTGSSSSSTATSSAAAAGLGLPSFDYGLLSLGVYIFAAVMSGAAIIVL